jgi:hypothetical protein
MTTAEGCQRYADECLASVREAKNDGERKAFLDMARAWIIAAAKANGRLVHRHADPITGPRPPESILQK